MSISYPLSLPTNKKLARIRLTANDIVGVSQSPFTGAQQVYQYTGQFWEAEISLPPMKRADAEYWVSFLLKLNGAYGTFLLGDPNGATARGVATGTPFVNGGNQSGNELITDGWTPSVNGILKAGDYIQIGSAAAAKLHKVLDDVDTDSGGNATLTLWPAIRTPLADDSQIIISDAKGVFRLSSNSQSFSIDEATFYGITFAAREAL